MTTGLSAIIPAYRGNATLPPDRDVRRAGTVHVWYAWLDLDSDPPIDGLEVVEQARIQCVKDDAARRRKAWSHVILRRLLSRYLGNRPTVSRQPTGKPTLGYPRDWLKFSLSRSGAMAAYALSGSVEVGIDIEVIDLKVPVEATARWLPRPRCVAVEQAQPCDRAEVFFRQWTAYEAEVKTTGEGLGGLRSPGREPLEVRWPAAPDGYAVAVAACGAVRSVVPAMWQSVDDLKGDRLR